MMENKPPSYDAYCQAYQIALEGMNRASMAHGQTRCEVAEESIEYFRRARDSWLETDASLQPVDHWNATLNTRLDMLPDLEHIVRL